MEEKNTRGGKRKGAGRKPTFDKKNVITLYVLVSKIHQNGGKEKLKSKLYDSIENDFVCNPISERSDTVFNSDKEPKRFEQDELPISSEYKTTSFKVKKSKAYFQKQIMNTFGSPAEHMAFVEEVNESDLPQKVKEELIASSRIIQS